MIVKCISDCDTRISDIERGNVFSTVIRRWSRINRVSAAHVECASSIIYFITAASWIARYYVFNVIRHTSNAHLWIYFDLGHLARIVNQYQRCWEFSQVRDTIDTCMYLYNVALLLSKSSYVRELVSLCEQRNRLFLSSHCEKTINFGSLNFMTNIHSSLDSLKSQQKANFSPFKKNKIKRMSTWHTFCLSYIIKLSYISLNYERMRIR